MSAFDKGLGVVEEALRSDGGPSRFGKITAKVKKLKPGEYDPNTPYEPIAEGDDLGEQFARMHLFALGVNDAAFPYRGDHQNSNTFASAALKAGGLPPATAIAHDPTGPVGELLEYFAPGLNEPLGPRMGSDSGDDRSEGRGVSTTASPSPQIDQPDLRVPPRLNDGIPNFYSQDPAWLLQIRR